MANDPSIPERTSPPVCIEAKRDASGHFCERTVRLGIGPDETRRYAYDSAGRLARVTDGRGGLREYYQYDSRAAGWRISTRCASPASAAIPTARATAWARQAKSSTATTRLASAT